MNAKLTHEAVAPVEFLLGTWRSTSARGQYAERVAPFAYCEELEFTTCGQPMLGYKSTTWRVADKRPMHSEAGFLRVRPGTRRVSLLLAHNFGMTTIEEGDVHETRAEIKLQSTGVHRPSDVQEAKVLAIERHITLTDDARLRVVLSMATGDHPEMTQHLAATYEKVA